MPETDAPKRSRGRPRRSETQRQDMRDQIEQAAARLFQSEGYGAISMRRIAKAVGCSPMAIYAYFDNKVDLLRSLWEQVFIDLFQQVGRDTSAATTSRAQLRALSAGYVQYWIDHPERYRMVFMSEGISQSDVSLFIDDPRTSKHFEHIFDLVSKSFGVETTEQTAKQKMDFLLATLHGIAHTQVTMSGYDWADHKDLVDFAIDAIAGSAT
ncbi:MAG: TetR/AcrR family transcriptional regulator [Pseudomonadota bacterium]